MISHKDIITLVHVAFMTPAAMTKLFILPVSLEHLNLIYTHFTGYFIELFIKLQLGKYRLMFNYQIEYFTRSILKALHAMDLC